MGDGGRTFLVTGGTGFLGTAIVRLLVSSGCQARIMVRGGDDVMASQPGVELFLGSVTDRQQVERAADGIDGVFHLVGIVQHSRAAAAEVRDINVQGSLNVIEAAAVAARKRGRSVKVVFASTSGSVAVSKTPVARGDADGFAEELVGGWPYYSSKVEAERLSVEAANRLDVPLVILRPSSILGPGETSLPCARSLEYYRHKSVYKHVSRSVPFMPKGGINFVDVRDVAEAFVRAMDCKEADGGAFCLGGEIDMTLEDFFVALEELSGVPRTRLKVPYLISWGIIASWHAITSAAGKPYHVDPVVVEMAHHYWYVDSSAAKRVLGFKPRSWRATLRDTLIYIRDFGHTMSLPKGVPHMPLLSRSKL